MTGETRLPQILSRIDVEARPTPYVIVSRRRPDAALDALADARINEGGSITYIVTEAVARAQGELPGFVAAWLTLRVHTALNAVGVTASIPSASARRAVMIRRGVTGMHSDTNSVSRSASSPSTGNVSRVSPPPVTSTGLLA